MFYINGEQLKMDSPQGRRYQEWKETTLSDYKDPVVLKSGKPIKFNPTGLVEPPKNEWIPFKVTIGTEEGTETWIYSPVLPIKKKDDLVFPERGRIFKHGHSWRLEKNKDVELIYFMTELSPFVKSGRIIVMDKEKEARKEIDKELGTTDVKFLVYSPNSPLSVESTGSEDMLRIIASSWGVEKVEDKGINEVRVALRNAVEKSNANYGVTKRGYKEFLAETKVDELMVLRANIQRAIDRRVIVFKTDDMTCRFASGFVLMKISPRDWIQKEAAVFNMLRVYEDKREQLYLELGAPPRSPVEKKEEDFKVKAGNGLPSIPDNLSDLRGQDLMKLSKAYGLKAFGVKKEAMIEALEALR